MLRWRMTDEPTPRRPCARGVAPARRLPRANPEFLSRDLRAPRSARPGQVRSGQDDLLHLARRGDGERTDGITLGVEWRNVDLAVREGNGEQPGIVVLIDTRDDRSRPTRQAPGANAEEA